MKQNERGRLIAVAAKAHLLPLGCWRKGQSRFWSADHGFWQIGIEFQPSGWSKGSYLNVGIQWLWYPKSHFSFDTGYRVADFVPFESETQFAPEADRLAWRAAEEVRTLRGRFCSLPAVARELEAKTPGHALWPLYHAAVAAGLAGDTLGAQTLFGRLLAEPAHDGWWQQRHAVAAQLAFCLRDPDAYRRSVLALIEQCRALQRLPPAANCLDGAAAAPPQPAS